MKIICVGRNYVDHAKELGNQVPEEPVIFLKPKNSLLAPGNNMFYPAFTNELHYECELVVKINKNGKFISAHRARHYYDKISLGIDFTARDIQDKLKSKGLPWEKAKAFDSSAAVGNFVPISHYKSISNLHFQLFKNEQLVQDGHTTDMLFSVDTIIADVSQYFSLNIGDLIFTGTPAGVGECVISDRLEGYLEGEKLLDVTIE
jgi:2-keto-4-pentenoate hydratase/2-oxohepta-3-ene-1,7-dioic acid hydratase in catechol pathway